MSYLMSASSAASSACGVRLPAVVMAASASGTRLTVHVPLPACATVGNQGMARRHQRWQEQTFID